MVAWSLGVVTPEQGSVVGAVTCQPMSSFTMGEPNPPALGSVVGAQPWAVSLLREYPG